MTEIEASDIAWKAWVACGLGYGSAERSRLAVGWPGRGADAGLGGCAGRPDHVSDTRCVLKMDGMLA